MKPSREAIDEAVMDLLGLRGVDIAISAAGVVILACDMAIKEVRAADEEAGKVREADTGPTLEVAQAMETESDKLVNQLRALRGAAQALTGD